MPACIVTTDCNYFLCSIIFEMCIKENLFIYYPVIVFNPCIVRANYHCRESGHKNPFADLINDGKFQIHLNNVDLIPVYC